MPATLLDRVMAAHRAQSSLWSDRGARSLVDHMAETLDSYGVTLLLPVSAQGQTLVGALLYGGAGRYRPWDLSAEGRTALVDGVTTSALALTSAARRLEDRADLVGLMVKAPGFVSTPTTMTIHALDLSTAGRFLQSA